MSLTQLDVINEMLASLGEMPVNEIDVDHDLIASGVRKLKIINTREQAKGWWFNTDLIRLAPDVESGMIYVPSDTINVTPTAPHQYLVYRARRLYNPRKEDGYNIGRNVDVRLVREIPFDDLPPLAQSYIGYSAIAEFQKDYDADRLKYEQTIRSRQEAFVDLRADDIRNRKTNLLHTPSNAQTMWSAGVRHYRSPSNML